MPPDGFREAQGKHRKCCVTVKGDYGENEYQEDQVSGPTFIMHQPREVVTPKADDVIVM